MQFVRLLRFLIVGSVLLATSTGGGAAQDGGSLPEEGVLVRVDGDVLVGPEEEIGVVVAVGNGTARVSGEVGTLVLVNATGVLTDARVGELVVVGGTAHLLGSTVVEGNAQLVGGSLDQAETAEVRGDVVREQAYAFAPFWFFLFGLLFLVGFSGMVIAASLVGAGIAPRQMRAAGRALTKRTGQSLVSALIVWVGIPLLSVALFTTVVGIPLGFGLLFFVLPALWFIGYVAVAIRLGEWISYRKREASAPSHPYLAAFVGSLILIAVAWIPGVGPLVSLLAGAVGAGALALVAWRSVTAERKRPPQARPAA